MLQIQFNKYMVSGEDAPEWSKDAYQLMRTSVGLNSGQLIGDVLYLHYVEGMDSQDIKKRYSYLPRGIVGSIIRGNYSRDTSFYFHRMLENEPEMLDLIYKPTIITQ